MGLISAGIGAAAQIGSTATANKAMLQAQRETNELNYKIWGEQQQHNVDMFNMQNQANIDMWNMQNEYNDPSQQIARLSAAGLNPRLALGGNPTGNASSAPAAGQIQNPAAPQMQMPPAQAFDLRIGEAVNSFFNNMNLSAQTRKTDAETGRLGDLLPYEISMFGAKEANLKADTNYKLNDTKFMKQLIKGQKLQNKYLDDTYGFRVQQEQWTTANLMAENTLLALDKEAKTILNKYAEPRALLDLESTDQAIVLSDATVNEKRAAVRYLTAQAIGQEESNKITKKTADSLVAAILMEHLARKAGADADSVGHEARKYVNSMDLERDRNTYLHHGDLSTDVESFLDQGKRYFGRFFPFLK